MLAVQPSDNKIKDLKVPPHSIEAEQSVLGGVMLDNETWEMVSEILLSSDFYVKNHREIFKAMESLGNVGHPMDVITLSEYLEKQGETEIGLAFLGELAQNTPSIANIRAYAEIVREKAITRQLIAASNEIADASFNPEGRSLPELLDLAERTIFKIAESRETSDAGPEAIESILKSTISRIEKIQETKGGITGLSTGFSDLDEMTSGLQPADLVIVAARPSMGKTTFAMNMVEHAALNSNKPVLVFSLEMPSESIIMRSISSLSGLEQNKIRSGRMHGPDWDQFNSGVLQLKNHTKLFIDDTAGISPAEMRSRARRIYREHGGMAMIMVDYLQLMQVPGYGENRTQEVSEISRSLKALAKELNVPVVALSQLNRSLENRSDRRPVMADLRESGAIEQDADVIMFIYRDEVYNKDSEENKGRAEVIIGKQRNGPIGTIHLAFQGAICRFNNLAHQDYEAQGF